jgi:WD40 repeat protein
MTTVESPPKYVTLGELRLAHRDLLSVYERTDPSTTFLDNVERFLPEAREIGRVLEDAEHRRAAQGILDYWTAALLRAGRSAPDLLLAPFDEGSVARRVVDRCPYPGLAAFSETQEQFFYGREAVVADLCARLHRERFVSVEGPRGVGKSSLVRAGLLPALKRGALPDSSTWRYWLVSTPGESPLEALARFFAPGDASAETWIAEQISKFLSDPTQLAQLASEAAPALLVIDQLEDVLGYGNTPITDGSRAFVDNLIGLVQDVGVQCKVIATVRSDDTFDPHVGPAAALFSDVAAACVPVPELGSLELRAAIVQPAEFVGLRFEPADDIINGLVRALIGVPLVPPLLQFVLAQLWDRRRGDCVTGTAFEAVMWDKRRRRANVGWAVARTAEELYQSLGPQEQDLMQRILLKLVVPGEDSDLALARLTRAELAWPDTDASAVQSVLDKLLRERLVRASATDDPHIELIHEALARNWPTFDHWLMGERLKQARRRRLTVAAKHWLDHDKDPGALWGEALVEEAQAFEYKTADELDFLQGSLEAVGKAKAERERGLRFRIRAFRTIAVIFGFAVFFFAAAAFLAYQNVLLARASGLSAHAMLRGGDQPDLALLLGLRAFQMDPKSAEARDAVWSVLERNVQLAAVLDNRSVARIVFSPDGRWVASAHADKTIVVHDAATLLPRDTVLSGHTFAITAMTFSPDGELLASADTNGEIRLWDVGRMTLLGDVLHPSTAPVLSIAFNNDGSRVVSVGSDGVVTSTAVRSPGAVAVRTFETMQVGNAATLSGDGTLLAISAITGDVQIWDVVGERKVGAVLKGQAAQAKSLAFSPHGDLLAAGGATSHVVVWRTTGVNPGLVLDDYDGTGVGAVTSLAFSSDGSLLASGGCGLSSSIAAPAGQPCVREELRLRDVNHAGFVQPPLPIRVAAEEATSELATSVAFSSDNTEVAVASDAGVSIFDLTSRRREAAVSNSRAAVSVDLQGGGKAVGGCGHFSDQRLCNAGQIEVFDAGGAAVPGSPLRGHASQVSSLAVSKDGRLLASGARDGTIIVWDLGTQAPQHTFTLASPRQISALAFHPTQPLLASNGEQGDVRLWNIATGEAFGRPLIGHTGPVRALAFAPTDGSVLASGGADKQIRLWDVQSQQQIGAPLQDYKQQLEQVAFSPDGRWLHGDDGETTISWRLDLDLATLHERACRVAHRNLTGPEWKAESAGAGLDWNGKSIGADVQKVCEAFPIER